MPSIKALRQDRGRVWVHALGRSFQQPVCGGNTEVGTAQNSEPGLEVMAVVQVRGDGG